MLLLHVGVYDMGLMPLCEVTREPDAQVQALEQLPTYSLSGLQTQRVFGLHFTFDLSPDQSSILCIVSRGFSSALARQLLAAIGPIAAQGAAQRKQLLESMVERYAGDALILKNDKLEGLSSSLERLKSAAVSNVEEVLERSGKIDVLVERTDQLASNTTQFKRSARLLEQTNDWRDKQGWLCVGCIIVTLLLLYVVSHTW